MVPEVGESKSFLLHRNMVEGKRNGERETKGAKLILS